MEQLNLPTVYMAQSVHVDASLVSKWKTGRRTLSSRSVYFDDIIQCLMAEGEKSEYRLLKRASTTEAGTEIYLWISAEPH